LYYNPPVAVIRHLNWVLCLEALLCLFFPVQFLEGQTTSISAPMPVRALPPAQVIITLYNGAGSRLPTMGSAALTIFDNKKSASPLEILPARDEPIVYSLLVDASASMKAAEGSQTAAAINIFKALSRGDNRGYLILFRDDIGTENRVIDAKSAERILEQAQSRRGSTALYDAIVYAATKQLDLKRAPANCRRVIVALTDGGDNISRNSLDRALSTLEIQGIPIFTIAISSKNSTKRDRANLLALTQKSGGEALFLDDPGDIVGRLTALLDEQYLLRFMPTPGKRGKLHSLSVMSRVPNLEVSAPAYYRSP
jgi:hypothetical protein